MIEIEEGGIDWEKHVREMVHKRRRKHFYQNTFDSLFEEANNARNK